MSTNVKEKREAETNAKLLLIIIDETKPYLRPYTAVRYGYRRVKAVPYPYRIDIPLSLYALLVLTAAVAEWLNNGNLNPVPALNLRNRKNRGIQHDIIGRLLCPIELDWDNEEAGDKPDVSLGTSFYIPLLYRNFKGNPDDVEQGFLQNELLIATYQHLFNSPSSTQGFAIYQDADSTIENPHGFKTCKLNKRHNRADVANLINMKLVTARSIAYVCVQLHFAFSSADSWLQTEVEGFNYIAFYDFIVDFFEESTTPTACSYVQNILSWWNTRIFPQSVASAPKNTFTQSKNKLREQRIRHEREAAEALAAHAANNPETQ
ncbi:hypothetical protein BDQ17DRAFT_1404627 [Cyathus striatus]|nr:hypothetical protein BDQ17DRAFT_1404627 [Cyathus striatus]